jgi:hypothetical protein
VTDSLGRRYKTLKFLIRNATLFSAPSTVFAHIGHFALHLDDDRVVIAGGSVSSGSNNNAPIAYAPEIWDPVTATWEPIKDIQFEADDDVTAGKLDDGTVLFVASNERSMRQSTHADSTQFRASLTKAQYRQPQNPCGNAS